MRERVIFIETYLLINTVTQKYMLKQDKKKREKRIKDRDIANIDRLREREREKKTNKHMYNDIFNIRDDDDLVAVLKPPQIVLVGNKVDEERLRKVSVDHHCRFSKQFDLKAFYVSAKTGDSVAMMFRQVAADVLRIVLTRVEQEADIAIVQGAVTYETKNPRHQHIDQSKNTMICSLQ
ncbi:hypothetical protein DICVIV_10087 [Dictyocaulus viviparus]|uniref:Ras family protein n=1 Tax=Dictyocaulus viviparus TaxID=29172 RepID=A0A0D8XJH2_DICVI|nr:hypothetical protein DICVIV_10087 [Dictyocaulus viviparus]